MSQDANPAVESLADIAEAAANAGDRALADNLIASIADGETKAVDVKLTDKSR